MSESQIATIEDVLITRDEKGKIVPIEVQSSLLGKSIRLLPVTYGWIKRNKVSMEVRAVDWPLDVRLDLVKAHIVRPDLTNLTMEDVTERMGPLTLNHLVSLVVAHSVPTIGLRYDPEIVAKAFERVRAVLQTGSGTQNSSSTDTDTPTLEKKTSID